MDEAAARPRENSEQVMPTEKKGNPVNTIMIVQLVVCIFAVVSVFLIGRLSPQTFEFIKNEYNRIMSVDMDAGEFAASAKKVIGQAESAAPQESVDTEQTENKKSTKTVKSASDGNTLAVMSLFKSDEEITVPVHGEITSEYGNRTNPVSGEYLMHSGIDIAADSG